MAPSTDPLDALLDKLTTGDAAAAEGVFRAYEPYLRKVVRRQLPARLRAKFDSIDVVQSIWADILHGFREAGWRFRDAQHLRAFLVKVTRNRFIDRCRRHQSALLHEVSAPGAEWTPPSREPGPSELVQADELWDRMLALCPPAHRELLQLKRSGVPLPEIVARTGLHDGSIRRILRALAGKLAASTQP
jgi:RNA polymerase sigma-70 factor (ECF subfamily)